ncbi:MAG TPA: hypothetical protein PLN56_07070 [Methanoregulaceae archaeon]|nr:MAG: hypothetical protein IPI71_05870 [Methanolinea sp.]HON81986.1 hypothetical protein [Methanoregulaceae archaeon]HPD10742.1 hypothetical protein [Methanoregulaceae archaeon]
MRRSRSEVGGKNVHKKCLVRTALYRSKEKKTEKIPNPLEHLLQLREWILAEQYEVMAFESMGDY